MIKNLLISLFISTLVVSSSYAAGSSDSGSSKTKTKYDMAVTHIKAAKNFEKKDKPEKAKKSYLKAQKLLVQSNKNYPNKACLLYTSPSPRDPKTSRMPSSA